MPLKMLLLKWVQMIQKDQISISSPFQATYSFNSVTTKADTIYTIINIEKLELIWELHIPYISRTKPYLKRKVTRKLIFRIFSGFWFLQKCWLVSFQQNHFWLSTTSTKSTLASQNLAWTVTSPPSRSTWSQICRFSLSLGFILLWRNSISLR